jgi:hypothetical protein
MSSRLVGSRFHAAGWGGADVHAAGAAQGARGQHVAVAVRRPRRHPAAAAAAAELRGGSTAQAGRAGAGVRVRGAGLHGAGAPLALQPQGGYIG